MGKNKNIKTPKQKNNNSLKSIIFVVISFIFIGIIFVLSTKSSQNESPISNFDITSYSNITSIGINEFEASFGHDGISVILFCSNEIRECQNEIIALNEVGKENNIYFEYINVVELVDSEIEQLETISDIFKQKKYPNLVIINSGEIVNNTNTYLEKKDIEKVLKDYNVI